METLTFYREELITHVNVVKVSLDFDYVWGENTTRKMLKMAFPESLTAGTFHASQFLQLSQTSR